LMHERPDMLRAGAIEENDLLEALDQP
jgi:hypothetical protein